MWLTGHDPHDIHMQILSWNIPVQKITNTFPLNHDCNLVYISPESNRNVSSQVDQGRGSNLWPVFGFGFSSGLQVERILKLRNVSEI